MSGVRVLVGTRKGAFILMSDGNREKWDVSGPYFGGWEIYHLKGSPVDPNRIYVSQFSSWFGQIIQRSDDGGKTWGPIHIIAEDGANALNNPTAVVLRKTNRVILMYQRYAKGFDEHNAEPGFDGPHVCRTFTIHSDNNGLNWSQPIEITSQVKRPIEVTSTASGPGRGIQLTRGKHVGRILLPFNQGPYGHWKVYAGLL